MLTGLFEVKWVPGFEFPMPVHGVDPDLFVVVAREGSLVYFYGWDEDRGVVPDGAWINQSQVVWMVKQKASSLERRANRSTIKPIPSLVSV